MNGQQPNNSAPRHAIAKPPATDPFAEWETNPVRSRNTNNTTGGAATAAKNSGAPAAQHQHVRGTVAGGGIAEQYVPPNIVTRNVYVGAGVRGFPSPAELGTYVPLSPVFPVMEPAVTAEGNQQPRPATVVPNVAAGDNSRATSIVPTNPATTGMNLQQRPTPAGTNRGRQTPAAMQDWTSMNQHPQQQHAPTVAAGGNPQPHRTMQNAPGVATGNPQPLRPMPTQHAVSGQRSQQLSTPGLASSVNFRPVSASTNADHAFPEQLRQQQQQLTIVEPGILRPPAPTPNAQRAQLRPASTAVAGGSLQPPPTTAARNPIAASTLPKRGPSSPRNGQPNPKRRTQALNQQAAASIPNSIRQIPKVDAEAITVVVKAGHRGQQEDFPFPKPKLRNAGRIIQQLRWSQTSPNTQEWELPYEGPNDLELMSWYQVFLNGNFNLREVVVKGGRQHRFHWGNVSALWYLGERAGDSEFQREILDQLVMLGNSFAGLLTREFLEVTQHVVCAKNETAGAVERNPLLNATVDLFAAKTSKETIEEAIGHVGHVVLQLLARAIIKFHSFPSRNSTIISIADYPIA
ncbi:MAG: hypothetical protein M1831_003838 [Alyxoria varia]|nr:MAG: hypothetical protein M1831_003838 [Alyxoria varia]